MGVAEEIPFLPFDEYLAAEQVSERRHEYVSGRTYLMAGGTERHDLVAGLVYERVAATARKAGCRPFSGNRLIRLGNTAYYPDVFVTCSKTTDLTYEHDLSLVVEVLSPSTADVDRREKSIVYASAPSFEQYVLVHPDQRRIEVATLGTDGLRWQVYGPGMVVFTRFGDLAVDALHDELDATALT